MDLEFLAATGGPQPTVADRVSVMASKDYFFFTDANKASNPSGYIKAQTAADAYGPVTPATPATPLADEYRITSLHSATFNPTAYAPCDAIACVQQVSATLVNIVLKPLVQPIANFAPIKYIIYKGILASSLVNGAAVAAAATNDLTKSIWKSQTLKNASALTNATPSANALGLGLTASKPDLADDKPIDNLFYRTGEAFQLPVVDGGWSIGQFDKTGFGMEVLMEGLAFHHTLALARKLEHKISVLALTGSETGAQTFDHWHDKEQILGFMDPCAFYGSFFLAGIQAKSSGATPFAAKAGNDLYQDLLFAFFNKNTAYLDIRNEHNFSLNYFKNYGNFIKLGGSSAPVDYYASKWPILTLSAANFPITNLTARNAFSIQLPVGDNPQPLAYVSQGYRDINAKGDEFPPELTSAERFYDAFEPPVGGYTATKGTSPLNSLAFALPNVAGQVATTPVSCYIRLKYFKQQQGATTFPTVIKSANYLDNLIYPFDLRVLFSGTANIKSAVYDEEIYVNARNVPGLQFDAVGKLGIARDANTTSLFVIPTVVRTNDGQGSSLITLSGETSENSEAFANLIASKYPLVRVRKSDLVLSATALAPIAEFVSDADTAALSKFGAPDFSKFLIFVVANSTYDAWKSRIVATGGGLDSRFRVYLGVKNLHTQTDTLGVAYTSFELVLRGFAADATTNNYKVDETGTDPTDSAANIMVYTSAPAAVTCSITSGADGMLTACVPVNGAIKLKAAPSSGSGTFQWSTTSTKITLSDTTAQTVTVTAKTQVSASRGAEKVQLVFTPTGGIPLPPITRDVTIISVKFSASATQNYGYDDMDNVLGTPHHVSVREDRFTTVHVDILDHATADDLEFVSDDITIAEAVAPAAGAGASFELTIVGKNQTKAETGINAVCKGGPVCATIKVNVYKEVVVTAVIAKVHDSASPNTSMAYPNFDVAAAATNINSAYKSAVVKFTLTDADPAGNQIDVPYDKDGDGTLTLGAGVVGSEINKIKDIDAIKAAIAAQQLYVVLVRDLKYIFYLATPAAKEDRTLKLQTGTGISLDHLQLNKVYALGLGAKAENVVLTSRNVDVFDLQDPLGAEHDTTDGIILPIGGVTGRPGDPIVVLETVIDNAGVKHIRTEERIDWIIGHELGHGAFRFANVTEVTNLMYESESSTGHKLRYKALPDYNHPNLTESQWEKIQR